MTTGKTIALTIGTFVGKGMFLLLNMLSGFPVAFLPRSKYLLISWLQSPLLAVYFIFILDHGNDVRQKANLSYFSFSSSK